MGLFDVHAHLTHPTLQPRLGEILDNAAQAGVTTIVTNGLNPRDNEAVRALAAREASVRPAFGFYPVDAVAHQMRALGVSYPHEPDAPSASEAIAWLRAHVDEAVAVGEIGLDGHWVPEALWEAQEEVFRALVEIALEADKPIIVHTRKREARTLQILSEMGAQRVNWHCFGGKLKLAQRIADQGHCLSIPANARRSHGFAQMLRTLPRRSVLLETDCPYLSPERDTVNEPSNVALTAAYAAELWHQDVADVTAQLADNFARLFGFAP